MPRLFARTARAQAEQGVAVRHGVHRVDAACQTVVRGNGQAVRLYFGQDGIGGHDADGGVGARQQGLGRLAAQQGAARVRAVPGHRRCVRRAITWAVSGRSHRPGRCRR